MRETITNEEAIIILENLKKQDDSLFSQRLALDVAIKALERDAKVDNITAHWNDKSSSFVSACEAFEDILDIYNRYIT